MQTFSLTSFVDKVLGLILSVIESLIIAYLVLVFAVIPFVNNGTTMIQDSFIASRIIQLVPDVSQSVMDMSQYLKTDQNTQFDSPETLTKLMLSAIDMNLIDSQQAEKILSENILNQLNEKNITLTPKQKQQIEVILQESGYSKNELMDILGKINVSGE